MFAGCLLVLYLVLSRGHDQQENECRIRHTPSAVMARSIESSQSCGEELLYLSPRNLNSIELGCNERYASRLICADVLWLLTRADFLDCEHRRDDGTCRLLSKQIARRTDSTEEKIYINTLGKGAENAAWFCNGSTLTALSGIGYGGSPGIFSTAFSFESNTLSVKSQGGLIISSDPKQSNCEEHVSYMSKSKHCAFDGKISILPTEKHSDLLVFARLNRCSRGGRSQQVTAISTHNIRHKPSFERLRFNQNSTGADDNLYFFVLARIKGRHEIIGAFPAVLNGIAGIWLTASRDAVIWSKPLLVAESKAMRGWRTTDHVVDDLAAHIIQRDETNSDLLTVAVNISLQRGISLPNSIEDENFARRVCHNSSHTTATKECPRCYTPEARPSRICDYEIMLQLSTREEDTPALSLAHKRVHVLFAGELRFSNQSHFEALRKQLRNAFVYIVTYKRYRALAYRMTIPQRIIIVPEPNFVPITPTPGSRKKTVAIPADWFRTLCSLLPLRHQTEVCLSSTWLHNIHVTPEYPGVIQWGLIDLGLHAWFVEPSAIHRSDTLVRARTDLALRLSTRHKNSSSELFPYSNLADRKETNSTFLYCQSDKIFYARVDTFLQIFENFRDAMMRDFNGEAKSILQNRFYSERAFGEHLRRHNTTCTTRVCFSSGDRVTSTLNSHNTGSGNEDCSSYLHSSLYHDRRDFHFGEERNYRKDGEWEES